MNAIWSAAKRSEGLIPEGVEARNSIGGVLRNPSASARRVTPRHPEFLPRVGASRMHWLGKGKPAKPDVKHLLVNLP